MTTTINADDGVVSGSAGLKYSSDSSGVLALQTNGTTAVSISTGQVVTLTNALPVASGGSGVTTSTGTGDNVLGTTPSFTSTIGVGGATASASGAGITFPATQSASSDANTLDDYEEGTWTATFFDAVSGGNQSSTTTAGHYTKIGDMVFFSFNLEDVSTAGLTGANQAWFTLPFISSSTTNKNFCASVHVLSQGINWAGSQTQLTSFIGASEGRFRFYVQGDNQGYAGLVVQEINNGTARFYVSGQFRV
jgi:hypothetical protein